MLPTNVLAGSSATGEVSNFAGPEHAASTCSATASRKSSSPSSDVGTLDGDFLPYTTQSSSDSIGSSFGGSSASCRANYQQSPDAHELTP